MVGREGGEGDEDLTNGILRKPHIRFPLAGTVDLQLERRSLDSPTRSGLFVRIQSETRGGQVSFDPYSPPRSVLPSATLPIEGRRTKLTSTKCLSASPTPLPPPNLPETVPPLSVDDVEPNLKCELPPFGRLVVGVEGEWEEEGGPERMKSSAPETTKVENLMQ